MKKTTIKTPTISQRIVSYLGSRKTPATRTQIVKAMPKLNAGSVKRILSYMVQDGNVQTTALKNNNTGRVGYMLIQSN